MNNGNVEIRLVRSEEDAECVRVMAWEFVDWLKSRYPEMLDAIDEYLANQDFRGMLGRLLDEFSPPHGECLLALLDGRPVGILMMKPHSDDVCEMNRMFVRPQGRGHGVGRALCLKLMEQARQFGYRKMVLSALDRHDEALSLYRSLGFQTDERNPDARGAAGREVQMILIL